MLRAALPIAVLAVASLAGVSHVQAQSGTQVGVLTCNVSGNVGLILTTQKTTACVFNSQRGRSEHISCVESASGWRG